MTVDITFKGEVAYVLPVVAESAPHAVREGIARRRLTLLEGECPCGAVFSPPNRQQRRQAARHGGVLRPRIKHENDCPATDANLRRELNGGRAR